MYLARIADAMISTPQVIAETPEAQSDLLSDLLGAMHLSGTVLFRGEFREPWAVDTPGCEQLARMLPFRTEHIVPFHIIAAGGCSLEMPDGATTWLSEGDAILLPYGAEHRLGGLEPATAIHVGTILPRTPWQGIPLVQHGGAGAVTSIVCGFVQCDELLFHPLLRQLPTLMHVRPGHGADDGWLSNTIRHTASEAARPAPGSRNMLPRLTEVMFVEILRKHMHDLPGEAVGWFAAVNDPVAGKALKMMHKKPQHPWTIDELVRGATTSRTVLRDRFMHYFGQAPMQYLAAWRMQLAAQELKSESAPLKTISSRTGYDSEAAFSRAFKRHFGSSPADWRKKQSRT